MATIKLIGDAPNQVSRNKDLGSMAYQDLKSVVVGDLQADGNVIVDGSVGIGTSAPIGKLNISGSNTLMSFTNSNAVTYSIANLDDNTFRIAKYGVADFAIFDSSGNLGLGVTPSAWEFGKALEVGNVGHGLWYAGINNSLLVSNAIYSSGYKYAATGTATHYQQYNGQHQWWSAPSGTAGNPITFTQDMTLDTSGHLIVPAGITLGTTAGTYNAANTLDDYEEGLYTPTFTPSTSGTIGLNTGNTRDKVMYTKVGRVVNLIAGIQFLNSSSPVGTSVTMTLPFAAFNGTGTTGSSATVFMYNGVAYNGQINNNATTMTWTIDASTIADGSFLYFSITYVAA